MKLLIIVLQVCLTGTGKFTAEADSNHLSAVFALQDSGDSVTQFTQGLISLYQYLPEKERTLLQATYYQKSLCLLLPCTQPYYHILSLGILGAT